MNKPYGYKEKDLVALAEYIKGGGFGGKSLSRNFKEYAAAAGKAAGSVRNLYYTLAKFSQENAEFTREYLGGKPLSVGKSEKFSEDEKSVIGKIAEMKARGVSVRRATICLAGGDVRKALRYQNKYRNSVKKTQPAGGYCGESVGNTVHTERFLFERLKREINGLADRLSSELKRENSALLRRITVLEAENGRLRSRLNAKEGRIAEYFSERAGRVRAEFLNP